MAIGGASGYLTVNPTQDYVGQALQGANESFARIRAEKYQKERDKMTADQNLREQRRQDLKDAEEFSAKYPYAAMGDNDKQLVMNLKKTYTEARRDFINTGSEKSQALSDKAMSNLMRLNESKKAMSLKADEMLKNEKDYNPTSFNKVKDLVAIVGKNLVTRLDDNGNVVSDIVKRDPNTGAIIGIEKENISDGELKQMFEIEPKFDVTGEKGINTQFIKALKTPTLNSKMEGNNKVTTSSYPEAPTLAETFATEAIQNHSGVYYALEKIKEDANGKPISLDPEDKSNYSNPEVLKLVHDYYKNNLLDLAPSGRVVDPNYEAANHALNADSKKETERHNKAMESKESKEKKDITYTAKDGILGKETTVSKKVTEDELIAELSKDYTDVRKTGSGIIVGKKNGKLYNVETGEKIAIKTKEAPANKSEYSNVTETDKGTIGVKNGKWYYVKTGKLAQ